MFLFTNYSTCSQRKTKDRQLFIFKYAKDEKKSKSKQNYVKKIVRARISDPDPYPDPHGSALI
jgi:hypothetical protein